jgi:hypothetical protein
MAQPWYADGDIVANIFLILGGLGFGALFLRRPRLAERIYGCFGFCNVGNWAKALGWVFLANVPLGAIGLTLLLAKRLSHSN